MASRSQPFKALALLLACMCGIAAAQEVRLVGRFSPGPDDRPAKLPQVWEVPGRLAVAGS